LAQAYARVVAGACVEAGVRVAGIDQRSNFTIVPGKSFHTLTGVAIDAIGAKPTVLAGGRGTIVDVVLAEFSVVSGLASAGRSIAFHDALSAVLALDVVTTRGHWRDLAGITGKSIDAGA
jgi:hypothetical protein